MYLLVVFYYFWYLKYSLHKIFFMGKHNNRYQTIEGINFDLKNEQDYIAENGKEAFFKRKAETCWHEGTPINEATKNKRITAVYDAAIDYDENFVPSEAAAAPAAEKPAGGKPDGKK